MSDETANLELSWYLARSRERQLPSRCPFATVERCPRYYQSASLVTQAGLAIKMDSSADARLRKAWERSELWPQPEDLTAIIGGNNPRGFWKFCPEIAFDSFGVFSSTFGDISDATDAEFIRSLLARQGVRRDSPRWRWASLTPVHYTECPFYPLLAHEAPGKPIIADDPENDASRSTVPRNARFRQTFKVAQEWVRRAMRSLIRPK
jgi:hypothetical protein